MLGRAVLLTSSAERQPSLIKYSLYITDRLKAGDVSRVIYKPTGDMESDYLTKALQGKYIYINYILLKVVAALQMKSVILHAPATTSRLATPAAIKDGLLLLFLRLVIEYSFQMNALPNNVEVGVIKKDFGCT